jgi:hypothetical protein
MIFLAAYPAMNPIVPPAPIGLLVKEEIQVQQSCIYSSFSTFCCIRAWFVTQTGIVSLYLYYIIIGFSNTLDDFLRHSYKLPSGLILNPIEEDLAITYGFRNFAAHKIENQPVIYQSFQTIVQRCLNVIFFAIESSY